MSWSATVLTLFPGMFPGPLAHSLAGRAMADGAWRLRAIDIRDHATDKHRSVDDIPFGGGPGMVMRADVVAAALDAAGGVGPAIYLSARGQRLTQDRVKALADGPGVTLLCGRFEGVDQRVIDQRGLEEIAVADVVLSGGEPAAMILLDACVRLLPGVMGAAESGAEESFAGGLLEYPHYTRPAQWAGLDVPEVLLSGHHAKIKAWRRDQAEQTTRARRPDLWAAHASLNQKERRS